MIGRQALVCIMIYFCHLNNPPMSRDTGRAVQFSLSLASAPCAPGIVKNCENLLTGIQDTFFTPVSPLRTKAERNKIGIFKLDVRYDQAKILKLGARRTRFISSEFS